MMLQGIRVLDLSRVIAGPYCAMLMADLGADVVKLERPGRGDESRAVRGEGGMNAVFAALNRNKRSVVVDLQHPEGRRVAFELVEAALATAPTAEWVARFEAASIAAGPIYEFDEVFEDPQVRHLGLVIEMDQPGYGRVRMLNFPFKASATPGTIRRPAPLLGEHTAEVLREIGLPRAEIERLAATGAIGLRQEAQGKRQE